MRLHLTMSGNDASERHAARGPFTATALRDHAGLKVYGVAKGEAPANAMSVGGLGEAIGPRLHLAERDPQHHGWASRGAAGADLRLRILLSYHYYKDTDLDALFAKYFTEPYPEVFLDSGAFSADTQGVSIDIQDYIAYIKRYRHLITTYSNLDVIRNPEGTWRNQQVMEDRGLAPLPVFHGGTDWSWLEHYIERYPYIALGGLVGKVNRAKGWLVRCFQMAQGRAVFHGFGVTAWQVLRDLPWYSVDSSSWGQGFRYGQVPVFDERKGAFVKIQLGDRKGWGRHSTLVRSLGFDPMDFADRSRNDRAKVCAISAISYMLAERWLRKRHGEIHIPNRSDAHPGMNLHLVAADSPASNMGPASLAEGMDLINRTQDANGAGGRDLAAIGGLKLHLAESPKGGNDIIQHVAGRYLSPEDTR